MRNESISIVGKRIGNHQKAGNSVIKLLHSGRRIMYENEGVVIETAVKKQGYLVHEYRKPKAPIGYRYVVG